jgi:hypothetical protein
MVMIVPLNHRVPLAQNAGAAVETRDQVGGSFSVRPARLLKSEGQSERQKRFV